MDQLAAAEPVRVGAGKRRQNRLLVIGNDLRLRRILIQIEARRRQLPGSRRFGCRGMFCPVRRRLGCITGIA